MLSFQRHFFFRLVALVLLSWAIISPSFLPAQIVFEINDFKAEKENLNLRGSAKHHESLLRLTPSEKNQVGACWYEGNMINLNDGFYTEFEFRIFDKSEPDIGADGLSFVVQAQSPDLLGGQGNDIGYKDLRNVLAIEFDIFQDLDEESSNHVCLSFYDPQQKKYRKYATVHEIPELSDGDAHFARIEYRNGELIFYLDSYLFPILTVKMDIGEKIGAVDDKAWVGFTSSTSDHYATHDLLSWTLGSYSPPPKDIDVDQIAVEEPKEYVVKGRKLRITIWDGDILDRDTVSIKIGDEWVLTDYEVVKEKKVIKYTLKGFSSDMVMYAHNMGMIPPNTASIEVYDGENKYRFNMKADLTSSQSIRFRYQAE